MRKYNPDITPENNLISDLEKNDMVGSVFSSHSYYMSQAVFLITFCIYLLPVTLLTVEHLKEKCPVTVEWGENTSLRISK